MTESVVSLHASTIARALPVVQPDVVDAAVAVVVDEFGEALFDDMDPTSSQN